MERSDTINVAIADDHLLVRAGLERFVDASDDVAVVISVGSGEELLAALATADVDVCTIDISMPGLDGLETLRRLRTRHARLPVLMCSMHDDTTFAVRCLNEGANGYLTKGAAPSEFLAAIRRVHSGQVYISGEVLGHLLGRTANRILPHQTLSAREFEVFIRLARGATNGEIASELHLDQRTVSEYRRRALNKLGVERTSELVEYAIRHELIS